MIECFIIGYLVVGGCNYVALPIRKTVGLFDSFCEITARTIVSLFWPISILVKLLIKFWEM